MQPVPMTERDTRRDRASALNLHGLLAHWSEAAAAGWPEALIGWEEDERARRSLERRLQSAHIGRFKPLCDPNIAHAFRNPWHYSVDRWKYWDAIYVPILVVRGQQSDLLPKAVLRDMMRRNRNVRVHTVQNCGHAPALITDDQIEVVTQFLYSNDPGAR